MKAWHVVALVAGAFVVGGLVCRPDRSLARAELERDSLRTIADSLLERDARRSAEARAAADSSRRRQTAIVVLEAQAAHSRAAVTLLQRQLDSIPGVMVPRQLVNEIVAGKDVEIRATIASQDSTRALLLTAVRLRAAADSAAHSWRAVAIARGNALDNALRHRRWGCVVGAGATIGPAIAGSSASLFGGSIGVTVSCGRKVV